jgi:hypothetical protein
LYDTRARVLGAAVLGKTRGAGRASRDVLPVPLAAAPWSAPPGATAPGRANDGPRRVVPTRLVRRPLRRLPVPPQSPATPGTGPIPRQFTRARGVAAVNKAVESLTNNRTPTKRTDEPNDSGRWA